ncbi:MAG: hypothetical protein Hyperionvirus3_115 [Hyperionvirus sp.]|uniref:Uncharacterized protein n=1 Tax=Hyperionvirus sp. TaxID=2487770 RepID=A0A3G5ACA2_9VIRU|nr:MAG: hypothetical protein Hyperionvirus3_115 [Hyperionvirus sp.]
MDPLFLKREQDYSYVHMVSALYITNIQLNNYGENI